MINKIKFGLVCMGVFFLYSCKEETKNNITNDSITIEQKTDTNSTNNKNFRENTIAFFKWYKNNRSKLDNFKYLKGGYSTENDSTAYYIDKNEVEKYINEIEKSGFVSSKYINNLKEHLNSVSSDLEKEKIYSEVVDGLDYDLITKSQDDEDILANIINIKLIKSDIEKHNASLSYKIMPTLKMKINFSLEKNKWLIDNYDFEYEVD